jgi:hypothetical protein
VRRQGLEPRTRGIKSRLFRVRALPDNVRQCRFVRDSAPFGVAWYQVLIGSTATSGAEDSLSAIVGVRSELAAGDLWGLYLAWLSAYGGWERDEDAFGDEAEDAVEPPLPAGLGSLTAPQRALADFLRLDPDLLAVVAQASPELPEVKEVPAALAAHIAGLPGGEKDRLLVLVARDQATRARMELLRGLRGDPDEGRVARPRRTVADLLDAAAELRLERHRQAGAEAAAWEALRERQREAARQRRLDDLAKDPRPPGPRLGS